MNSDYDAIVVGAGASGLFAGQELAKSGLKVAIFEKENEPAKKLSITGGGRCNITNAEFDNRKLLENYGEAKSRLFSAFAQFSVKDAFEFFEKEKLPLIVEAKQRAFPKTKKAKDVSSLLVRLNRKHDAQILLKKKLTDLKKEGDYFILEFNKKEYYKTKAVILAMGGPSGKNFSFQMPQSWKIAENLGHAVHLPNAKLAPIKVRGAFAKRLSGLSLSFVNIKFRVKGKILHRQKGKVLFTHFGLSGPSIINSAKMAQELYQKYRQLDIVLDFFPDTNESDLEKRILKFLDRNKNKKLSNALSDLLPTELLKSILIYTDGSLAQIYANELKKEQRKALIQNLKSFSMRFAELEYKRAIVADGGVDIDEINFKNMQSKIVDGLFITGDMLNINRPSGGFSLQLCWTTGYVAAQGVVDFLKKKKQG